MTDLAAQVRRLRDQGLNAFAISAALNIDLSEVRRLEDPRAAATSRRWAELREVEDQAAQAFARD